VAQYRIEVLAAEDAALDALLSDRLYEFNVDVTGISDGELLSIAVRDGSGNLIAGLNGHSWGGCCEVKQLWIDEQQRGQGLGSTMMMAAEREATRRGCVQIVLSTHSFQAPEFYESLGYIRLAAIPNYPKGHENILYIKYLQSSSDA
jgi:ribosomal protein S18 acetylase RimI-like enzyme